MMTKNCGSLLSMKDSLTFAISADALLTMIEIVNVGLIVKAHWKNRIESTDPG